MEVNMKELKLQEIVTEMQELALENKKIMSVSRNWWTGEVDMSMIRCAGCECNIDSDFVDFHEVRGEQYCNDCYTELSRCDICGELYPDCEIRVKRFYDNNNERQAVCDYCWR
jgi:hypothetical protein